MLRICLRSVWGVFATFVLFILFGTSCSHALSLRNPSYNNIWQDYGGGWSYKYQTSGDVAYWKDGSSERLAYIYNAGQWYDKDITNSWRGLGIAGRPSDFLGDRQWHDMGNGWKYGYTANDDTGWWQDGNSTRLAYMYGGGQWYDFDRTQSWRGIGYASMSSSFLGDGQWHDVRNGWKYGYTARDDTGWWQDGNSTRLAYIYTGGQWYDYDRTQTWRGIGYAGVSAAFLGDGQMHDVRNGWKYGYTASADSGYWQYGNVNRLAYIYTAGQWYDYYSSSWHGLGLAGISSAFIGDGNYHKVWSDNARYQHLGGYGYYSSNGVTNDDDFRISYSTGQWYRYYDGSTVYDAVEYKGNRQYLLTDYIYWTSSGLKSTTYTGSSYGTDVAQTFWSDSSNSTLAKWNIFTPGSDLRWSGGSLNVYITNTEDQGFYNQRHLAYNQYTIGDVLTFEYNLEGGVTLSKILDELGYLTEIFGKRIDNMAVRCHGSTTSFYWGSLITTSNYSTTYANEWTRLNNLMTDAGQLQLWHCQVGANTNGMLSRIASLANVRVFANVNSQWNSYTGSGKVVTSRDYGDSNVWNNNYDNWFLGGGSRSSGGDLTQPKTAFIDWDLEYQSDSSGKRAYTRLWTLYNPGYSQADMVYWWNNGNGRP